MTNLARIIDRSHADEEQDVTPHLSERATEVMKIMECLRALENNPHWRAFKKFVLEDERERVIAQISSSSGDKTLSLQGELRILRRFLDFEKLKKDYESELTRIKQTITHYGSKKDRSSGKQSVDDSE